tara:strand:- start:10763 stop:12232 length:1470 start_codon:yes stop_codon:yes gene_type:complete
LQQAEVVGVVEVAPSPSNRQGVVGAGRDTGSLTPDARALRRDLLLSGPIGGTLLRLAAPNVIAMFVQAAQSIAEAYFASLLGVSALAGLALVFPLVMLSQMLSAGSIGGAISSAVARALGAEDAERAGGLALAAWIIAIAVAVCSAVAMHFLGPRIFAALGGTGDSVVAAVTYASVFFPGCICLWLCHSTLSVIRGTGDMRVPSLLLLLVSTGSIPLSGALALGWGPFPALGMAGLPAGLLTAYAIGAIAGIGFVVTGRSGLVLRGAWTRLSADLFLDILKVGALASVNGVLTVLTIVLMVGMVGRYGEAALAGYGLGARLEFLMIPVVFGIGAAMTAMVGINIGAGQVARARRIAWTGACAAAAIVGGIGIVLAVVPDLWLGIFLAADDSATLAVGRAYFRTVAPLYAFFGFGLALYFACQGAGRMLWPVVGSVSRIVLAVGGAALLSATAGFGVRGVFIAIATGMLGYGLITGLAVWRSTWERRTPS